MLLLWMGVVELVELHMAGRKATIAAQTAADLIAQEKSITTGDLEDIVAAVNAVMEPYPIANMGYDLASIEADADGDVSVGWRFTEGDIAVEAEIPAQAIPLVTQDDSVIVATIAYKHQTIFSFFETLFNFSFSDVEIIEEAFSRPRRSLKISLN